MKKALLKLLKRDNFHFYDFDNGILDYLYSFKSFIEVSVYAGLCGGVVVSTDASQQVSSWLDSQMGLFYMHVFVPTA